MQAAQTAGDVERASGGSALVEVMAVRGVYTVTLEVGEVRQNASGRIIATRGWSLATPAEIIRQLDHK